MNPVPRASSHLPRILQAAEFMVRAHGKQPRKYTDEPYAVHPLNVARLVALAGGSDDAVIAALLHDVIEDTLVKPSQLAREFGEPVMHLVMEVTKVSLGAGDRATRMEIDAIHYSRASAEGQTIKIADMIDNTRTVVMHDAGFAKVYMVEKRRLLERLTLGSRYLYSEAKRQLDEYFVIEERKGHEQKA